MDRHEKGIEKIPGRLDRPLPEWSGSYGGDERRLPKVVQKLVHGKMLTAEEKAELLWRFYELDHAARARRRVIRAVVTALASGALVTYLAIAQRTWILERVMSWLSPPAAPPV